MNFVEVDTDAFGCEHKVLEILKWDLVAQKPLQSLVFRELWSSYKFYTLFSA